MVGYICANTSMSHSPPLTFRWCAELVGFRPGETLAAALRRQGIVTLGVAVGGLQGRYFCGIGSCQACLVSVDGASATEACLTLAKAGTQVTPVWSTDAPTGARLA